MATKRRRKRRAVSTHTVHPRRKRRSSTGVRRRRRSTGLRAGGGSLMANVKGGLMAGLKGAGGGVLYNVIISKMLPGIGETGGPKTSDEEQTRNLMVGGALMIGATFMKQPLVAAGIGGALSIALGKKVGLLDDDFDNTDFVPDSLMMDIPQYINDNGRILLPLADGSWREATPMEQRAISSVDMSLAAGNFDTIYPGYNNPGMYDQR